MPELPDIELYRHCLRPRLVGARVDRVRVATPFIVRSVEPPVESVEGSVVADLQRRGKRIVITFEDSDAAIVIHLMIAGRFRWYPADGAAAPMKLRGGRISIVGERGTLWLTEAGTEHRASVHLVRGDDEVAEHDPGGLEPIGCELPAFAARLRSTRRTLKRALTDPRTFSGIGNAYSDEILHAARLSPTSMTTGLDDNGVARLHAAVDGTLTSWRDRLISEVGDGFPKVGTVTAFRPDMAVHGKFGEPCPVCGARVERIVRRANECNYCPGCQTGGRVLKDRSLSRLLKDDWPGVADAGE